MDEIRLPDKKIALITVLTGVFSIVIFIMLVISLVGGSKFFPSSSDAPSPTLNRVETNTDPLRVDYSKINKIVPGQTSFAEAQKINGKANSVIRKDGKTYLFYKTPIENRDNIIAVQNNTVFYSTEYVYGDYRKSVDEFKREYGNPDLFLFDQADTYPWAIFLTKGVGIKSDGKDVGEIVYFIPQSEQNFMNSIAKEINLSASPSAEAN